MNLALDEGRQPGHFNTAKRNARNDATRRGHNLGTWNNTGFGAHVAVCKDCNAQVRVRITPDQKESWIESKPALATDWSEGQPEGGVCRTRKPTYGGGGRGGMAEHVIDAVMNGAGVLEAIKDFRTAYPDGTKVPMTADDHRPIGQRPRGLNYSHRKVLKQMRATGRTAYDDLQAQQNPRPHLPCGGCGHPNCGYCA